jgi:hypothetical protein
MACQGGYEERCEGGETSPFERERRATRWSGGEPVRADESVSDAMARFTPESVPDPLWARVGPTLRRWAETADPDSAYAARTLLSIATQLILWTDAIGLPFAAEVVLHPDVIDRFVTEGCAALADGTRLNYRRHLRVIGAAVLGPTIYPPRPLPIRRAGVLPPNSPTEIAGLLSWARGLPTARFRHTAEGIVVLGLGAGLTSQEMSRLVGTDIEVGPDGVLVSVIGEQARLVPVLASWEKAVAQLAHEAGSGPVLMPGRTRISRHQLKNFQARCPSGDAPILDTGRLRATWVCRLLEAGADIRALEVASGVKAQQIVKYLEHVPALVPEAVRRQLRGSEW